MIIEVRDITNNTSAVGHSRPPPPGITLGQIFEQDSKLKAIAPCVVRATLNNQRVDDWRNISPLRSDKILIDVVPRYGIDWLFYATLAAYVISAVVSIVTLVLSIFNRPKPIKSDLTKDSPTYSFEGIRTSFSPGGPVQVVYGEHLVGGQLLSTAIDITPDGVHQQISILLGLGHGSITDISCLNINDIPIANFGSSATWDWRAGVTSQAALSGFEWVRNTYSDGREMPEDGTPIVYTSQGNDIDVVQGQIAALQGLGIFYSGTNPRLAATRIIYRVQTKRSDVSTWLTPQEAQDDYFARYPDVAADPYWGSFLGGAYEHYRDAGIADGRSMTPALDFDDFIAATRAEAWHVPTIYLGAKNAYDLRFTYLGYDPHPRSDQDISMHNVWLRNVTEISAQTQAFSGNAILAVKALGTAQLHGGAPNITAMERGRLIRAYSDETTYVNTWTRNPAWCILDYMTNSVYGMGPFITRNEINMQSFIDFASLCDSLVSDGNGGLEAQHCLDIILDKKKPHWTWINDMLGLYNSAMIYSQARFKIISERADLPVRQIFHSGNIVPGTLQLTIGADDPIKPNQATVSFPNRVNDYAIDLLYVQNSASIYGLNEPIKEFDLSLLGITRESEAVRNAHRQLERKRTPRREVQFQTGLEALSVEPGDMARVGIATTDFELGYGGRILDGSINHLVLDREITINSGYTYDMFLWHLNADSMEERTLASTPGPGNPSITTITVTPSTQFNIAPAVGDRYAIGVTSEDLTLCYIKKITRTEAGLHNIIAEQYVPISPVVPELVDPSQKKNFDLYAPPPQPISVVSSVSFSVLPDGTVTALTTIDISPAPLEEGGRLYSTSMTAVNTHNIFSATGSHANVSNALNQDMFRFVTGSIAGAEFTINSYTVGATKLFTLEPSTHNFIGYVASGDYYMIQHRRGGDLAGFDLYSQINSAADFAYVGTTLGLHYETTSDVRSFITNYKIIPFSTRGVRNNVGNWVISNQHPTTPTAPSTPSGLIAIATPKGVLLDWSPNPENDLAYYGLYRSTANAFGGSTEIVNTRADQFIDGTVTDTNNFYWVRAFNTWSLASPIYPGSTAGVTATPQPITNFIEYTSTACLAIPIALTSVATALFVSTSGVTFFNATVIAQAHGLAYTQPTIVLQFYPRGVNSSGVPEILGGSSDYYLPGCGTVSMDITVTDVLSVGTYLLDIDIQAFGASSVYTQYIRLTAIETRP